MPKPTDVNELRDSLLDAYDMLARDPKRVVQVGELANTAGKILGTVKAQMEYALARGEEPDIPFMGKTSGKLLKPGAKQLSA